MGRRLTWDLNFFWEIMAEDNKSDPPEQQNSQEDLSEVKRQNVLASDAGNGEAEDSQQMASWERFWGPDAFLPSYLGSGDLKPEAVFQFMCPQGNSNSQYGEHNMFLGNPDINYQQFCGSMPDSFQTLVPHDLLDMPFPWDVDGNCNIKKDGVTGIQDEMTDFQTQFSRINGLITPDVHVGESGQSVVPLSVHTTAIVNSFDDDADVCIIENLSDPSCASRPINTKRVASHAAASDSVSHMGMGGTKFRANDERRAVVQEMMVCEQCGGAGFENAYVYCVNCLNFVIHRYCLPSLPATFDEFVNWLCVDCESELRSRAGAKGAGKALE